MSHVAVIDVGTNSAKMLVAAPSPRGLAVAFERSTVTRLGTGLHATGQLSSEAMERTLDAVSAFVAEAEEHGVETVVVVGTMGLRTATNAGAFRAGLRQRTGVELEVLGGDEEARLSCRGALANLEVSGRVCVFDVGGGSTEIVVVAADGSIETRRSEDVGARVATERFLTSDPVTKAQQDKLDDYLSEALGTLDPTVDAVIGVGGTLVTLASVSLGIPRFDRDLVHGHVLDAEHIGELRDRYGRATLEQRRNIVGLPADRADVALAGASIVHAVLRKLEASWVTVSAWGLRHGLLLDRFTDPSRA